MRNFHRCIHQVKELQLPHIAGFMQLDLAKFALELRPGNIHTKEDRAGQLPLFHVKKGVIYWQSESHDVDILQHSQRHDTAQHRVSNASTVSSVADVKAAGLFENRIC